MLLIFEEEVSFKNEVHSIRLHTVNFVTDECGTLALSIHYCIVIFTYITA